MINIYTVAINLDSNCTIRGVEQRYAVMYMHNIVAYVLIILSGIVLCSSAIAITDVCDISVRRMHLRLTNRIILNVIIFTVKLIVICVKYMV